MFFADASLHTICFLLVGRPRFVLLLVLELLALAANLDTIYFLFGLRFCADLDVILRPILMSICFRGYRFDVISIILLPIWMSILDDLDVNSLLIQTGFIVSFNIHSLPIRTRLIAYMDVDSLPIQTQLTAFLRSPLSFSACSTIDAT
jgi:hypothetical protein